MQEGKVTSEKERVDVEREVPALMYKAPPYASAEHVSNIVDAIENLYPDVRMSETAPPFFDEQEVNSPSLILRVSSSPRVPVNPAPFPDEYDIMEKVHPVMVVVVPVEVDPPFTLTTDTLTVAAVELADVTVSDVNVSDPFEI